MPPHNIYYEHSVMVFPMKKCYGILKQTKKIPWGRKGSPNYYQPKPACFQLAIIVADFTMKTLPGQRWRFSTLKLSKATL